MTTYYDISTANERLSQLRPLLEDLRRDRDAVARAQLRSTELASSDGGAGAANRDLEGGVGQGGLVRSERQKLRATVGRMETAVRQIDEWGVTLRDIGSGLVDFPALVNGRPIWLCWRLGEADVGWWHELDAGVAGRRPLIELE